MCRSRISAAANEIDMGPTEHIFGESKLKKVKIGDLVRWHTLIKGDGLGYKENIGIVTTVKIDHRGGRNVAIAKIIPLGEDTAAGHEIEMFLACVKVISPSVLQ